MQHARPTNQAPRVIVLIVGIALVMIGQFVLDRPADTSDAWHWIQHGVLFAGGLAVGGTLTLLYQAGRRLD